MTEEEIAHSKLVEPISESIPIESTADIISASPNLIKAYSANMIKVLFLFAFVIGAYFLAIQFVGQDYVFSMIEEVGVSISLIKSILIGIAAIILVLVIFDTSSLSSIYLGFNNDSLTYSHGNFFKVTKTFPISSIIRANYREYWPLKTGILELELSGTTLRSIKIPYVSDVMIICQAFHDKIKTLKDEEKINRNFPVPSNDNSQYTDQINNQSNNQLTDQTINGERE